MTRHNKDRAAGGRIHGGKRQFGWEDDRKTLRQWEADLLAKAIRDIPKGKTIATICKEWTEAGVVSGKQGVLRAQTVVFKVTNPRVCGYRVYMSAEERREETNLWLPGALHLVDGEPVIGEWERIVTPDEWKACVATLEERRIAFSSEYASEFTRLHARYLLSGIVRCGECGSRMYGRTDPGAQAHHYRCLAREGGCGKLRRHGPAVDEHVEAVFLEATRRSLGEVEHEEIDDTVYDDKIKQLREEITAVMARRKDPVKRISTNLAMDLVSELEAEIAELTYKTRTLTAAKVKRQHDAPSVLAEWSTMTIDMKREHLRRDISAVVINRSGKGYRWNPELLEICWGELVTSLRPRCGCLGPGLSSRVA